MKGGQRTTTIAPLPDVSRHCDLTPSAMAGDNYDYFTSDNSPTGNIQVQVKVQLTKEEIKRGKRVKDTTTFRWATLTIPLWEGVPKKNEGGYDTSRRFVCCRLNEVCVYVIVAS